MTRIRSLVGAAAVLAAGLVLASSTMAAAEPPHGTVRGATAASAIEGQYLVRLTAGGHDVDALADRYHARITDRLEHALRGFAATMTADNAARLAADSAVEYVEQQQRRKSSRPVQPTARPSLSQSPVSWGLDRIDQHALPLDNHYNYDDAAGQGVHVYVLDAGIHIAHPDFEGRAAYGPNFIPDGRPDSEDCGAGGGTLQAGIIAGAQYGVAKKASLVAVRVFDCNYISSGPSIENGFEWVIANAQKPAVIDFTLDDLCVFPDGEKPCEPETRQSLINAQEAAFAAGIAVVANAGDSGIDACTKSSGAAPTTFYVGASTAGDSMAGSSNYGSCLSMFAPGENIPTDAIAGNTITNGTYAAAAFVAGTVALFLSKPEFAGASPTAIRNELITNRATNNVLGALGPGSPNRLLFTGPPGFFTIGDPLGLAPTGDGRVQLFGVTKDGGLATRQQTQQSGTAWSGWTYSASKGLQSVGAGANADGRLELLGLTGSGETYRRAATATGGTGWFNWTRMSAPTSTTSTSRAVLARNSDGRMVMFTTTTTGQLLYRSQTVAGGKQWSIWHDFAPPFPGKIGSIATAVNADGRIEVLALDLAGQLTRVTQVTAGDTGAWTTPAKIPGAGMVAVSAARAGAGPLELVAADTGGNAWHRAQATAGSATWTDWTALPKKTLAHVAAATHADGRVLAVGVDNLGNIWQSSQSGLGSATYGAWTQLDGQLRP